MILKVKASGPKPPEPPPTVFMRFNLTPVGDGTYRMAPQKPIEAVAEVSSAEAMQLLGLTSRASLYAARDSKLGSQILQWRFTTPGKRRIFWQLESVLKFLAALRELDH